MGMGVVDRKAREFSRRESEILQAALALAGKEEWVSVTIDEIADRAEIGKGTFYNHFKSKDEVCARLVMDNSKGLLAKLKAIDPQMGYIPRFKEVLRTVWHHHMEHKEMLGLQMYCEISESSLNLSPGFATEFWSVKAQAMDFFSDLTREGIEEGIIARQPIIYLMSAGWSTMIGAIRLYDSLFPELSNDEKYLEYLVDYILKGMMNAQAPMSA